MLQARANAQSGAASAGDMAERAPRRATARVQTRRKHEAPVKPPGPRQCIEPECVKVARDGSKYCSDECGIKLAKVRIKVITFFIIRVLNHE
ncbi:hypothetical protein TELCIR_15493 [Teladorsagia circumcincta]|uniref:Uncharacterized protein n=1 Tax=Teladorsagia circumcincta TaxID=45464 RepID=A0A2G9TYB3_TELCI|nr:hypothetical protein TELCIR_15493 [Teladorsagia circumcincta]